MTATIMPNGKHRFYNLDGSVLVGGKLFTYAAGTVVPKATYVDQAATVPNTNPVILDIRGEALVRWDGSYKYVLTTATGTVIETIDDFTPASLLLGGGAGAGFIGFTYENVYPAGSIGKWLQNLALAAGSTFIGFIQGGVGAVLRTLQSKVRESVSVYDFMTTAQITDSETGNPTINAVASLQAATDYLSGKGGGTVIIPGVVLLKGSGGVIGGRVVDGVKVKSGVSYRCVGAGEVRLDLSCVVAFTTRILAPVTSLAAAPHDINFDDMLITRPGSTWNINLENTAPLYIGAINRMKVNRCRFVGWPGDAMMLGANDTADLTALYETYVRDVEVSGCFFDGVDKSNRQAISVFEGVDVNIHHNTFTRTTRRGGTDPMPGAVDIEPILATAKIANIRVEDNIFDDIGGVTGVVSFALGVALNSAAHDLTVKNNTFRNIHNVADVYMIGLSAADHTAAAAGSPYTCTIAGNTHDPLDGLTTNRRYYVGGLIGLTIEDNTIYGSNAQMLVGYDDGVNHWPIDNLVFNDNEMRDLNNTGTQFDPAIIFFGGIRNGKISGNQFVNCGNITGAPGYMNVLGFAGNGVASKNIDISSNQFVNTAGFSVNSYPIYAAALTNPTTFNVRNNTFYGLNSEAYNSVYSIYSQAFGDYFDGVVAIPSTNTPNVGGARNFSASTGDTFINFANGKTGQRITIVGLGSGCTIQNNANVKTATAANVVVAATKTIEMINVTGVWYQA